MTNKNMAEKPFIRFEVYGNPRIPMIKECREPRCDENGEVSFANLFKDFDSKGSSVIRFRKSNTSGVADMSHMFEDCGWLNRLLACILILQM